MITIQNSWLTQLEADIAQLNASIARANQRSANLTLNRSSLSPDELATYAQLIKARNGTISLLLSLQQEQPAITQPGYPGMDLGQKEGHA